MSLRPNIKGIIAIIQKAVAQAPVDKQPLLNNKITRVVDKYQRLDPQANDPSFLRELEFNLNFIKLSFPHLDYSPPRDAPEDAPNEVEEARVHEEFIELENKEQVQKFVEETEQVLRGVREEVEFSNWGAGNIDPEDLKRHKELLKRQYFAGEFWKGKEKPVSPTASYLANLMENQPDFKNEKVVVEESRSPEFSHDPDQNWEKVKR
jgi:hypothetical protein